MKFVALSILLWTLCCSLNTPESSAQQSRLDSLKRLPTWEQDSLHSRNVDGEQEAFNTLAAKAYSHLAREQFADARKDYTTLLAMAEKSGSRNRIVTALEGLGTVQKLQHEYPQAIETLLRCLAIHNTFQPHSGMIDLLFKLAGSYYAVGKGEEAIQYFLRSIELSRELNDALSLSKAYNRLGNVYKAQSRYAEAMKCYSECVRLDSISGRKEWVATDLANIASVYVAQGQYPQALQFYLKSLRVNEERKNRAGIAENHLDIGEFYVAQQQYSQALEYFLKSLTYFKSVQDSAYMASAYHSIGGVYKGQGLYKYALEYYHRSLAIRRKIAYSRGIVSTLHSIGTVFTLSKDYDSALVYERESYRYALEIKEQSHIAAAAFGIAEIFTRQGKPSEALPFAEKALTLYRELGERKEQSQVCLLLTDLYTAQGKYKEALRANIEGTRLKDSLFSLSNARSIQALQAEHANYREEAARKYAELQQAEIIRLAKRTARIQYVAIAVVVLSVLIFALVRRRIDSETLRTKAVEKVITFVAVLLLVEFTLLLLDPFIDRWSGGLPLWRMVANVAVAAIATPLHSFIEMKLRQSHS